LFEPGRNCYRIGRAARVALLVDGEEYFRAFALAALRATRSVVIIGWDFHSRTCLHHGIPGVPQLLGEFLNDLVRRRRGLRVRVLIWDYPMIFSKGRELSPIYGFGWRSRRRVRVRYDDHYPVGASQHQKIVVIDGKLAFCGGLDLTRGRWDSCEHRPDDERRINFGEKEGYAPFHDTVMAMDAEAAHILSEVARQRWQAATGRRILPRERQHLLRRRRARRLAAADPWPSELPVSLTDVDVAVARTIASTKPSPPSAIGQASTIASAAAARTPAAIASAT